MGRSKLHFRGGVDLFVLPEEVGVSVCHLSCTIAATSPYVKKVLGKGWVRKSLGIALTL